MSENDENIGYAVELLEALLDDDLKYLIDILSNDPVVNKMKRMEHLFPTTYLSEACILEEISSRSISLISLWTKACALDFFVHKDDFEINNYILSHFFGKNLLLSEIAMSAIHRKSPEVYASYSKRLSRKQAKHMQKILVKETYTLLEIVNILKQNYLLETLHFFDLINITKQMEQNRFSEHSVIAAKGKLTKMNLLIVQLGSIALVENSNIIQVFKAGELASRSLHIESFLRDPKKTDTLSLIALEDSLIFELSEERVFNLLRYSTDLNSLTKIFKEKYIQEKQVHIQ